jgi:alpha-N-arabinofuranosidase
MRTLLLLLSLIAVSLRAQAQTAPAPTALKNGGFESAAPYDGWELTAYGAAPRIGVDTTIRHEGARSLRIQSDEPTDTALGQEVQLNTGHVYRLSGWVRTRRLAPEGAPVFGTLQAQRPHGAGILATGENHGGDTDWALVTAIFQAPPGGRTRICIFFAGFGKGRGTAWFDDIRLEEVNPAMSTVVVTRSPLHASRICPFQYGQFIELLCNLVPGMWAEKLYDPGFEGLTPYKVPFIPETDFKEKPWYPCGAVNRARYVKDRDTKVSGEQSQRIAIQPGAPCEAGIAQDGVAVEKGKALKVRVWLRGEQGVAHVRITHAGATLASADLPVKADWYAQTATLTPSATASDATFSISFSRPGVYWMDNASLMPVDTVGGWRPDVVETLKALKPGIIRFGGSALDDSNLGEFDWRDAVAPVDQRKPFRAWGGLQQPAADLEEIVQLCHAVNAEPLICVRYEHRTPQDAADEIQYFNGGVDTPMGALRASHGHPAPYNIKYWQVGNERSGREYEEALPAFCRAMKAADPSIKLFSSYPTPGVMRAAGDMLDYVCPHQYSCEDLAGEKRELDETRKMIAELAPGRRIKVGVTEWNTTGGDWGTGRAKLWTLANALSCARYHNLLHRESDLVEIANRSNLTNSFCSGIIQTDNHRLYTTPCYYAQQLYATLAGTIPLRLDADLPPEMAPDISATLSSDGRTLTIFAINEALTGVSRKLDLSAFGPLADAHVWTLTDREHAGSPDVTNSFDHPKRISPVQSTFKAPAPKFTYTFPPLSLTVLQWSVAANN